MCENQLLPNSLIDQKLKKSNNLILIQHGYY